MEDCTRRVAIAGGLAQLLARTPLRAQPTDYDWQPTGIPRDTKVLLQDRRGRDLMLESFRGHPVLLNIWATWCIPCIIELPALDRLQRDMKNRLAVIALSVDRTGMAAALPALRKLSIHHLDAYVDTSGDVVPQLKIMGLPATVAISAAGDFLQVRRGRVNWDDPMERKSLATILNL